jgi:hypothetical protein
MAQIIKHYPIKGRRDFFKYTIIKTGEIPCNDNAQKHTDFNNKEMYFDDKVQAKNVCDAINRVEQKHGFKK